MYIFLEHHAQPSKLLFVMYFTNGQRPPPEHQRRDLKGVSCHLLVFRYYWHYELDADIIETTHQLYALYFHVYCIKSNMQSTQVTKSCLGGKFFVSLK